MDIQQYTQTDNTHVVVGYARPGRRLMELAEKVHDTREHTKRARDRGNTMIEIARTVTTTGGEVRVEAVEPDGGRFTMTVATASSAELENGPPPITAQSEVLTSTTALQARDCAE